MGTTKALKAEPASEFELIRDAIVEGLEAMRTGNVRRVDRDIPDPAPDITPHQVARLRAVMKCSQRTFAGLLSVSAKTVQAWEQGLRRPDGPARRLLQILASRPDVLTGVALSRTNNGRRDSHQPRKATRRRA